MNAALGFGRALLRRHAGELLFSREDILLRQSAADVRDILQLGRAQARGRPSRRFAGSSVQVFGMQGLGYVGARRLGCSAGLLAVEAVGVLLFALALDKAVTDPFRPFLYFRF